MADQVPDGWTPASDLEEVFAVVERMARADERRKVIAELESEEAVERLAAHRAENDGCYEPGRRWSELPGNVQDMWRQSSRNLLAEARSTLIRASLLAPEGEGGGGYAKVLSGDQAANKAGIRGDDRKTESIHRPVSAVANSPQTSASSPSSEPARASDERTFEFSVHGVVRAFDHEAADELIGAWIGLVVEHSGSVSVWSSTACKGLLSKPRRGYDLPTEENA
ncbi:MAG TPA: hypothetical protein VFF79_12985 [Conexibacter sp.]|jgi:hypothetical protein|nr:hypothetical protein [Conexibacter sp.]